MKTLQNYLFFVMLAIFAAFLVGCALMVRPVVLGGGFGLLVVVSAQVFIKVFVRETINN